MTQILGFQIDRPFVRAALLQKERGKWKIHTLKSAPHAMPENVKQLYTNKFKGGVFLGLSSKHLMVREIELNGQKIRDVEAALTFRHEGIYFLNAEETITIPYSIQKGQKKTSAILFTVPRETLKNCLEECYQIQLDPDGISANALALIHFIRWKIPSLSSAFLIDLGFHEWTCTLMEKGELKKTHALETGTESLLGALWEDRKKILLPKEVEGIAKQIDLLQIKSNLNPDLYSKLSQMRQELTKIVFSFSRIGNVKPIVFTGHTDAFIHLKEFLMIPLKELSSEEFSHSWNQEEQKYAIPIGLAIEQTKKPLQLLQKEFFPKKKWRRAGFYAFFLFSLSIFASIFFLVAAICGFNSRKKEISAKIQPLLERWKISSEENLDVTLAEWEKAVAECRKEYPYILQAPRVSEVLSWFSHHPLVLSFKNEQDPLELIEMRYQLIESPKIDSLNNRYLAKIDLQFKVKSPMNARKLHEALLQGDEMVDANQEISWETLGDGYHVSFFLKNPKVPYVP